MTKNRQKLIKRKGEQKVGVGKVVPGVTIINMKKYFCDKGHPGEGEGNCEGERGTGVLHYRKRQKNTYIEDKIKIYRGNKGVWMRKKGERYFKGKEERREAK